MLARLSPDGPDLRAAPLQNYLVERARRRPVEDLSRSRVEAAFVAGAFEPLALLFKIDGAGEVRAFLSVGVILALSRPYEYCRVVPGRVVEVQGRAGR
jgi:hypothetical protein